MTFLASLSSRNRPSRDELAISLWETCPTTLLHLLAAKNDLKGMESIMQSQLNVNARDLRRCTPLHIAALFGNVDIIEYLLKVKWFSLKMYFSDILLSPPLSSPPYRMTQTRVL